MPTTRLEKVQPGLYGGWGSDKPVTFNGGITVTGGQTITGNQTVSGSLTAAGVSSTQSLTTNSPTSGVGYATGAGGSVTQITSRSTGVTLSKVTGSITTDVTSLAAAAVATFTVTNTAVAISDVVNVAIRSGSNSGNTLVYVSAVAAGSFNVSVYNATAATAETGAIVINFAVLKAVTA